MGVAWRYKAAYALGHSAFGTARVMAGALIECRSYEACKWRITLDVLCALAWKIGMGSGEWGKREVCKSRVILCATLWFFVTL